MTVTTVITTVTGVTVTVTTVIVTVTAVIMTVTSVMMTVTSVIMAVTAVIVTVTAVSMMVTTVIVSVTAVMMTVTAVIATGRPFLPRSLHSAINNGKFSVVHKSGSRMRLEEAAGSGCAGVHRMIRVLVVDDHPATRVGVREILAEHPDIAVEEAADGEAALERVRTESWNLVLLDLSLPGRSGFEVLEELKSRHPALPVLILSLHDDEPYVVRALQHGAAGYLTKDCPPDELIRAVRKVAGGGHYLMAELSELLIDLVQTPADRPLHESLSSREYEVMRLLAHGSSLRDISHQLHISESTVSTYRARVLEKLRLKNNAQIIRYALDNNLD